MQSVESVLRYSELVHTKCGSAHERKAPSLTSPSRTATMRPALRNCWQCCGCTHTARTAASSSARRPRSDLYCTIASSPSRPAAAAADSSSARRFSFCVGKGGVKVQWVSSRVWSSASHFSFCRRGG